MEDIKFKKVELQSYFVMFIAVKYKAKMKIQLLFAQENFNSFQKWFEQHWDNGECKEISLKGFSYIFKKAKLITETLCKFRMPVWVF